MKSVTATMMMVTNSAMKHARRSLTITNNSTHPSSQKSKQKIQSRLIMTVNKSDQKSLIEN